MNAYELRRADRMPVWPYVKRALSVAVAACVVIGGPFLILALDSPDTPSARAIAVFVSIPWGIFTLWMAYGAWLWLKDVRDVR